MYRFWHRVEHIAGFAKPASLFCSRAKDPAQGGPEAKRAIADGQVRSTEKAPPLEIEQKFAPALGAFTISIGQAQDLLAAPVVRTGQHQDALFFFHSGLEIEAIRPDINDAPGAEIALLPALIILSPVGIETRNGGDRPTAFGPRSAARAS